MSTRGLLVWAALAIVVFLHIAGFAGLERTGTLLVVCAAIACDGVLSACIELTFMLPEKDLRSQ